MHARSVINRFAGLFVVVSTLVATTVALAAPGDLDRTFGADGRVKSNFTKFDDYGNALALQADGRIVVAGDVIEINDAERYPAFILERRKPDGALDRSFGNDGRVITRWFGQFHAGASALAIQADGKIVAAGFVYGPAFGGCCHDRIALARYRADGTLDPTFGGDGRVTTSFTPGSGLGLGPEARDIAIQPDGKIVAVAELYPTEDPSSGIFALVRYNPDGTLDPTFGGDGRVVTDMSDGEDVAVAVAIQADGGIIAAGEVDPLDVDSTFGLARYEPNGALDSTFGEGGQVTTDFTSGPDGANDVALQADGRIMAAGLAWERFALARYNTDGTLDTGFGGDGKGRTNFTSRWDYASGVAIQASGKIVAAGRASTPGDKGRFALARYNTDGTLDAGFGGDGKVTTNFTDSRDWALDVAVQANGRIVAAGIAGFDSRVSAKAGRFALARYRGG